MERLHIIRADVCWDEHLQLAQHAAQRGLQALQLVLRGVEEGEAPQRRGGAQGPDQVICVCIYIYIYIYMYVILCFLYTSFLGTWSGSRAGTGSSGSPASSRRGPGAPGAGCRPGPCYHYCYIKLVIKLAIKLVVKLVVIIAIDLLLLVLNFNTNSYQTLSRSWEVQAGQRGQLQRPKLLQRVVRQAEVLQLRTNY